MAPSRARLKPAARAAFSAAARIARPTPWRATSGAVNMARMRVGSVRRIEGFGVRLAFGRAGVRLAAQAPAAAADEPPVALGDEVGATLDQLTVRHADVADRRLDLCGRVVAGTQRAHRRRLQRAQRIDVGRSPGG